MQSKPHKQYGLIGGRLGHSLSPFLHARLHELETFDDRRDRGEAQLSCVEHVETPMIAQIGFMSKRQARRWPGADESYVLLETEQKDLDRLMPQYLHTYDGLNVTLPYKTAVIPYLRGLSQEAHDCGAVNCIFDGRGYNTDAMALSGLLSDLRGAHVLLLGYGGAACAFAYVCKMHGAERVDVYGRQHELAQQFTQDWNRKIDASGGKTHFAAIDERMLFQQLNERGDGQAARYTYVFQATRAGMWPERRTLPIQQRVLEQIFKKDQPQVFDAVYGGLNRFGALALRHGCPYEDGLRMLIGQAMAARQIWQGNQFPSIPLQIPELLEHALRHELFRQQPPVVLITGFMTAGKSLFGRMLAAELGMPDACIDLDAAIEKRAGQTIPQIFAQQGQEKFRVIEREALHEIVAEAVERKRPLILACGGGTLCQPDALSFSEAGAVQCVYLELSEAELARRLSGTAGESNARQRPLLQADTESERIRKALLLLRERRPLYEETADICVSAMQKPDENVRWVAELLRGGKYASPSATQV